MDDVALHLEREILGPHRAVMPCGCVMRVLSYLDLGRSVPGHPVTYCVYTSAAMRCNEHVLNCPYINQRFDE